jgi:hypothetical protein
MQPRRLSPVGARAISPQNNCSAPTKIPGRRASCSVTPTRASRSRRSRRQHQLRVRLDRADRASRAMVVLLSRFELCVTRSGPAGRSNYRRFLPRRFGSGVPGSSPERLTKFLRGCGKTRAFCPLWFENWPLDASRSPGSVTTFATSSPCATSEAATPGRRRPAALEFALTHLSRL